MLKGRSALAGAGGSAPASRNAHLFYAEGAAFTLLSALSMSLTNLFLTRLHASDYEISTYTMLTQLVGMVFLIPLALFAGRLRNKRGVLCGVLFFIAACFAAASCAPFLGSSAVAVLVPLAALGSGSLALYTSVWQAYFADVIEPDAFNVTYARRNRVTFIVNLAANLGAGALLSAIALDAGKVRMHQILYGVAVCCALAEIGVLLRIRGGDGARQEGKLLQELRRSLRELLQSRSFLGFLGAVGLLYLTWKLDGTIFYLAQVQYVGLSEFWLSVSTAGNAMGQILTVGLWAKLNEKMGFRFGLIFGALGLMLSPACIILPFAAHGGARMALHIVLRFFTDLAFTTIQLNVLQDLLHAVEEKNRTMAIAVYTTVISLLSAFMPVAGVALYTALGASEQGMARTFAFIGAVRAVTLAVFIARWLRGRRRAHAA